MFRIKLKLIIYIFSILFCFLSNIQAATLSFSETRLKENAEGKGFGYKTANLMELENVVENMQGKMSGGIRVAVPEFLGETSASIKRLFLENGVNIARRWDEIVQSLQESKSLLEGGKDPITILENPERKSLFISKSEKLARDIEDAEIKNKEELGKTLQGFLGKARSESWKLMVRSTGREDTKELPNAGGNYSESNVAPDLDLIINAIKKVVASYFEEKSLMQRIDGKDKKIFDQPLTPVFLQRMIGEKDVIPVGCVVYTRNPENNDPLTIIQAAFGHNEGVVTSSVNVDTFYVKGYESGKVSLPAEAGPPEEKVESKSFAPEVTIKKILQVKKQRIIPIETGDGFGLKLIENTEEIKNIPALSDDVIKEIDKVARAIDKYYNEAMDIELVYDPGQKIIYLVQARPLQIRDLVSVSYIENPETVTEENKVLCNVVSASGSGVKHITSKEQVVLASTLEEALRLYDAISKKDAGQARGIIAIIVKGSAEATSHAAAIFRGLGKIILVVPDFEKITQWLEKDSVNLYIDTQREMIFKVELGQEVSLKAGWLKYPIPRMISITEEEAYIGPRQQIAPERSIEELLEMLKAEELTEQLYKEVVASVLDKIHTLMFEEKDPERLEQLKRIYAIATRLEREIKINLAAKGLKSLELLYPVNFLEAILLQLKDPKFVDIYSVKTILEERLKQNKIKEKLNELFPDKESEIDGLSKEILLIMSDGNSAALTEEVGISWIKFVAAIAGLSGESDPNDLDKLKSLFELIRKFGIEMMWINTSFALQYKNNPQEFLATSHQELVDSASLLKVLSEKRDWLLNIFKMEKFRDPKTFQQQFEAFKREIGDFFIGEEFIEGFKIGTSLYKKSVLSFMEQLVDLWDRSIKELKGSTEFEVKDKVEKFQAMLKIYFAFLSCWFDLTNLNPGQRRDLDFVKNIISKMITGNYEQQLVNSLDFNVELTAVGNQNRNFDRYKPNTLEDAFTFIHQSLINVISSIYKDVFPAVEVLKLPVLLHQLIEEVVGKPRKVFDIAHAIESVKFTSYKFIKNSIVFTYNIPLRTHSIILQIKYDNLQKSTFIKVICYGDDEEGRWERISDYVEISSYLLGLTLSENIAEHMTSKFEWKFTESDYQSSIEKIIEIIAVCVDITFDTDHHAMRRGRSGKVYLEKLYNLLDGRADADLLINHAIVDLSLRNDRIHWFLPFLELDKIKDKKEMFEFKLNLLFRKLSDESSDYYKSSMVYLYKILNDPRYGNSIYYLINKENYDKEVLHIYKIKVFTYYVDRVLPVIFYFDELLKSQEYKSELIEKELINIGRKQALSLFAALIEKGEGFAEAAAAGTKGINGSDIGVQVNALDLFILLVRKGRAFDEAARAATVGINGSDQSVQMNALFLFKALVEKGRGFDAAAAAATTGMNSSDKMVQLRALFLFKALVEKGRGFDAAAAAGTKGINSSDQSVQAYALDLFEALFEKGQSFDAAEKIENEKLHELLSKYKQQRGIKSSDQSVQVQALDLFKALVEKGQSFVEAEVAATTRMNSSDKLVQGRALLLFKALVEKGQSFVAAEVAATTGMNSSDKMVQLRALFLFKALFVKGHGFDAAEKIENEKLHELLSKYKQQRGSEVGVAAQEALAN